MKRNIPSIMKMLGLLVILLGMIGTALLPASAAQPGEQVCGGNKVDVSGGQTSLVITAPEGFLISGYCVKAGSINQGDGPVYVTVNPPATSVTISHPTGKDISNYSFTVVPKTTDPPTTVPPTTVPPTVVPPTTVPPTTVPGQPTAVPPTTVPGKSTTPPKAAQSTTPGKAAPTAAVVTGMPSTGQGPDDPDEQGGMYILMLASAATLAGTAAVIVRQQRSRR